jgi:hypothetical protein
MKLDEFILVCDIQRILDTLETENVCLTMNPLLDEGHVKKLFITCQNRESSYTCSRDFDVENLLCEDDHEEYFGGRIAALIQKCERHMEA